MKIKKYTSKISAIGTAITGIIATDTIVKATRNVGDKHKHKTARMIAESTMEVIGTMAWMGVALKLWNQDDDHEVTNTAQMINEVRRIAVDNLTKMLQDIDDFEYDAEKYMDMLEDIEEGFSGRLAMDGVSERVNGLIAAISNNYWEDARMRTADLLYHIATREIYMIDDQDDAGDPEATDKVTDSVDHAAEKKAEHARGKQEIYEEYEGKMNGIKERLRNGEISGIDAAQEAMEILDDAPDFVQEAFKNIPDTLADIAERRAGEAEGS